ncbi:MAG: F0F1 ATP synthase subunit alpha, partial [Jiangellales bacterium]
QYRALEAFAAFASDLDKASRAQLDRGARLVELLKQPQYSPFPVNKQVVSLWSGSSGGLDDVPLEDIRRFETEFLDFVGREHSALLASIADTNDLSDDTVAGLESALTSFKGQFVTSSGQPLIKDVPVDAMEDEADALSVTKKVRKAPPAGTAGKTS